MQQRQLRLGDILDDYCPRERRVTNHAVVAMVGADVKQTRCTTCDAEHDYKHAKVPRQRKKADSPAVLYAQVVAGGPKRVTHEAPVAVAASPAPALEDPDIADVGAPVPVPNPIHEVTMAPPDIDEERDGEPQPAEDGPVHRRLIRAQLPRIEGQPPPARQAPDFTIRQPAGRINRFRPRHQRGSTGGADPFQGPGNRFNSGNGNAPGGGARRGGPQNQSGGRPPMASRLTKRQGPGRKRSK